MALTPVVQAVSLEDGGEEVAVMLTAAGARLMFTNPAAVKTLRTITVNANDADETPYILLAFDKNVTEEEIKKNLSVTKKR